ncbi:MAG: dTMP kinase [Rhodoferax sp.]|nr:dTMP kinase [Rhodoferax sp.]
MTNKGLFISFEGIDGAGKSTHIDALARAFAAQGKAVTSTREPGGTALAERLRAMILGDPMDPMTEALLVFAARRDHLQQVIEPALKRGEVLLCDRFTDATFAYQGSGRGFDLATLCYLERLVQTVKGTAGDFVRQPDLTVWFDLAPEIAAQRLAGARVPDKFEAQPAAFFQRVSDGYLQRLQADPKRFARIAADQPREAVWQDVLRAFIQRGWLEPKFTSKMTVIADPDPQSMASDSCDNGCCNPGADPGPV